MGGFTQDDGYVRGVAADALRGILLQRESARPRVADNPIRLPLTLPPKP